MIAIELKGNLFDIPNSRDDEDGYVYVHCIASDLKMGAGIAVPMKKEFKLYESLLTINKDFLLYPTAVRTPGVINMITKETSNGKPKYEDFISSLREVKKLVIQFRTKKLAMPQIGCGIDGLSWSVIWPLIQDFFKELDVTIVAVEFDLNEDITKSLP